LLEKENTEIVQEKQDEIESIVQETLAQLQKSEP
jgi:hypothetical protein